MTGMPRKRPAFEPASRLLVPTGYDPGMRRPAPIVAGFVLVMLRVLAGAVMLLGVAFGWDWLILPDGDELASLREDTVTGPVAIALIVVVGSITLLLDLTFGVLVFRGRNIARVIVMLVSVVSITSSFVAWWAQGQDITLRTTFVSLSLDILILLALSSRGAAAYARRHERR
ncbi:hypothetical protein ACFC3F_03755 [Microbacterium sp. NPDC055910]|uniref:hypothetical protein n=1 Tax=Microbacterium sp. NPDC055910 TaxID=3345659 RepID=UPI0035E078F6